MLSNKTVKLTMMWILTDQTKLRSINEQIWYPGGTFYLITGLDDCKFTSSQKKNIWASSLWANFEKYTKIKNKIMKVISFHANEFREVLRSVR